MYVSRILYPIEVLGPGKRIGIWFSGCPRRCKGCSNPELWEQSPSQKTTTAVVFDMIQRIATEHPVSGFTFTGGDPMMQWEALSELIPLLQTISHDILVYTGYRYEELPEIRGITAIIDGEYREEENTFSPLIGSKNQRLFLLDEAYRVRYHRYLKSLENAPSGIQNFSSSDGHISVGIHRPQFLKRKDKL